MRPGGAERSAAVILDVARRAATQANVTLPATLVQEAKKKLVVVSR